MPKHIREGFVRRLASSHSAGPSVEDAIGLHRQAAARGWTSALGYFDNPRNPPESTAMEYRKALSAIGKDSLSSLIDILAGRAAHVAVATHDGALAEEAVKRLLTTSTSCEIEQMSSLPQNCARIAKRHGLPMRVYIPHGYPSLPYNLRHAATRPIIIGWAVRDLILGPRNKLSPAEIVSDSTS